MSHLVVVLSRLATRPIARALAFVPLLLLALVSAARSDATGPTGRIQGKVVAADSGDPVAFADVLLIPADSTMRRVGGLTNADGTFLLEAAPGRYTLQIRALSYARKRFEGLRIEPGKLLPFDAALVSDAIRQDEVVVEARLRQNTEHSLLAVRRKAATVGDAVSAEQVRRSPDKDAAEVLRRVTGLSVSDGKYVFVRGLGERYSSTEVDGVRIATPEQNKRVVPLDLLPANLLENITVQKTYTADRPGEFGGGDVQVRTKDFPGARTWSFTVSQGFADGVTGEDRQTYRSRGSSFLGFGAGDRGIPQEVLDVAAGRPLVLSGNPAVGFRKTTLASLGRSFNNVWSPTNTRSLPNGSYSVTYGDEFRVLGRPLGVVQSWSLSRAYDRQDEAQRFFQGASDTLYDYAVSRSRQSTQLGGISGWSWRLSPRHDFHVRGLFTQSADDEVRTYEGPDHNRTEPTTGTWLVHRATRLMYVERRVLSGSLEGRHDFSKVLGANVDWKLTRSRAEREQPDRRETTYDRGYYVDGDGNLVGYWGLGSTGSREYGDLRDEGWGGTLNATFPWRLPGLGAGKTVIGWDRQVKERRNAYRRFNLYRNLTTDPAAPPESLFAPGQFDGGTYSAYAEEATLDIDNYRADQRVEAGFATFDVPLGSRGRGTFGVRVEDGLQDVRSFDLFTPSRITARGRLRDSDWLPSANVTLALTRSINMRLGASRTLSRPDLNELSPSPSLEYVGGMRVSGNPDLQRARIDNYDLRFEGFPGLSEVVAVGLFLKRLHQPIEQVIQGGAPPVLVPRNSDRGENSGVELELRSGLRRLHPRLGRLSLNANASFIRSRVRLAEQLSALGSSTHPLQGQASYLVNAALSYAPGDGKADVSVLFGATGRRLRTLGLLPLPDVYDQPSTSLDCTASVAPGKHLRLKLAARNLLDRRIRQLQGEREVSSTRDGRSYSVALSLGS